jgi:hypothetical protein
MDPVTTAITTAVLTDLGKDTIKGCYKALKDALVKKFGAASDLVDAVDKLEKKPDSEGRKATVQEEVSVAKANEEPEILKLAQDLLDKIREQPGGQEINNQTQINTVSGVNIGGNFEFKPVQEGKKS